MTPPLFTIIIPTYARPEYLHEAVESVLRQTLTDFECLVIDDASPEPAEIPNDPRFRLVRHDVNSGEAASRNTGLRASRGRFITFLDDDDVYTPERLSLARRGLQHAPVTTCWRSSMQGLPSSNRLLVGDVRDEILNDLTPHLGQVGFDHSIIDASFDERYSGAGDVEWWLRIAHTAPISTVPEVGMLYRTHRGPRNGNGIVSRVRASLMLLEERRDYFVTHPRATAFRWKRIGLMAATIGDTQLARRAFLRSLRVRPSPKAAWHLIRTMATSMTSSRHSDATARGS